MPRPLPLLFSGLLLLGLSLAVQEPGAEDRAERERQRLQPLLDLAAQDLEAATGRWARELERLGGDLWMTTHVDALETERERTGTVFIGSTGDSLACWTGQPVISPRRLLHDSATHLGLPDALYLHAHVRVGRSVMHGLRPVWLTPPIENRHLRCGFHPSFGVRDGALARPPAASGAVLLDAAGTPLFGLEWRDDALSTGPWLFWKAVLVLLGAVLSLAAWWSWAMGPVRKGRPWTGVLLFVLVVAALRTASLAWLPVAPFDRSPLFDPSVFAASFFFPSLGDLLMNALLFLACGLFTRRALATTTPLPGALPVFLCWTALLLLAKWVTGILVGSVDDSSIPLDLYHVQDLNVTSLISLLGMALFLGTWLLFADACLKVMPRGKPVLWGTGLAALALSIMLHRLDDATDTALFLWPVPLILILVRGHQGSTRFVHVVLGLACCALLAAHVLTRYTGLREQRERSALAERLATREDPVVEQLFRDISPVLRRDRGVYALLSGRAPCDPGELDRSVRQRFFTGYWERYDVRLFAFNTGGKALCSTDPDPPRSFSGQRSAFADPTAVADTPDLFIEEEPGRSPFYHARVAVMPADTSPPGQIIVELHPRSAAQGLGFPGLLLAGEDPIALKTRRYSHARYENRRLTEHAGSPRMPLHWTGELGEDGTLWYEADGRQWLAKGDPKKTLIVLGLPKAGPLDKATTFSYLFTFFSVLLSVVLGLRSLVRARGLPALGIGAKVRLALLLFTIAGSVFFGIGTQRLLERQQEQRFEAAILEKAASVHQELQHLLDGEPPLGRGHAARLDRMLARYSNVFFTDITVYSTSGRMLSTSRPQIFASGLLGRRMDPVAYERMALRRLNAFVHREAIGTASYRTAYMPLRDHRGQVLAYLALPGFADQAQQEQERADVLVAVVNLFVLLFALSVLVAVFISNRTTRPLDLLKNALARVGLQGANIPIKYRGDDEIGRLVEVYNRKVEELRESAERLARSERESAWREMARQVAHEIKNPLTPMKLSIQHFQRTWSPDAPDAGQRLERFSKGLIEQIDTLSGIAGAFSDFAQMPKARAGELGLAEVAETAMNLFRATPGMRCELTHESPGPLIVHADREQLLRVFNNLLKNAVQAIPDGREGRITMVLKEMNGEAIVEVRDNGTGIPEEDRERIFRPNFTTKGSGMGLGLAMVQRIVEGAGGRVWFESTEGEGSSFFVALPLRK